jgi:hypothetical protein
MKTFTKQLLFIVVLSIIAVLLSSASVQAGHSIGLNFIGNPDIRQGVMTPQDKAGLPDTTQTNWNNAAQRSGVLSKLVDGSGKATPIDVIWHTGLGTHGTRIEDKGDNSRMMRGYLDAGGEGEGATVTFTGIPYTWYDVIVYFDGDTDDRMRVGAYTVNGVTVYAKDVADFDGKFTEAEQTDPEKATAGNYVRFRGQTGASFSVKAEGISAPDEFLRAPINAIQIVEVRDPSTFNSEPATDADAPKLVSKP